MMDQLILQVFFLGLVFFFGIILDRIYFVISTVLRDKKEGKK